jgi:histidinol-phosphate aminotransferase
MTRTFSKIFGLAALRLGWAYCPPAVADVLNRIRGPFNVTAAAQAAGIAALGDLAHTDQGREHNDIWLPWLTSKLAALGLTVHPSVGNFILVRFSSTDAAVAGYNALMAAGCIARLVAGYGLPECIRITVGTRDENRIVVDALRQHLESA